MLAALLLSSLPLAWSACTTLPDMTIGCEKLHERLLQSLVAARSAAAKRCPNGTRYDGEPLLKYSEGLADAAFAAAQVQLNDAVSSGTGTLPATPPTVATVAPFVQYSILREVLGGGYTTTPELIADFTQRWLDGSMFMPPDGRKELDCTGTGFEPIDCRNWLRLVASPSTHIGCGAATATTASGGRSSNCVAKSW